MKAINRVIVEPYIDDKFIDESGLFVMPEEGSEYNQLAERGTMVQCPSGNIPEGAEVLFHYHAWGENASSEPYANYFEYEGRKLLSFPEQYIRMYIDETGEHPIDCIFIEHKKEEEGFGAFKEEITVEGVGIVTHSSSEEYAVGDEVSFFKNADFEIQTGGDKLYYIQYPNLIYRKNGELVNGWNKVKEYRDYVNVNGLLMKQTPLPKANVSVKRVNYDKVKAYKEFTKLTDSELMRRYEKEIVYTERVPQPLWIEIEEGELAGSLVLMNRAERQKEGYIRKGSLDLIIQDWKQE